jgi:hypothetical protein
MDTGSHSDARNLKQGFIQKDSMQQLCTAKFRMNESPHSHPQSYVHSRLVTMSTHTTNPYRH